jgi:RNA polymerase sigma-70 factor (ECF subfamily)
MSGAEEIVCMSPEPETPRRAGGVESWIEQARGGSQEALGKLLDMCRSYLLLLANQDLNPAVLAKIAPSDLVQDTMMEAGRDFFDFQGKSEEELLGWLKRMLLNNVANVHRHFAAEKRQVDREVPLEDRTADVLLYNAVQQTETPSKHAQAREQDERLEWAIRQLPVHYRRVLSLHTTEDLTFAQIAEGLGSTADAVRKLWVRAVDELAKLVESP